MARCSEVRRRGTALVALTTPLLAAVLLVGAPAASAARPTPTPPPATSTAPASPAPASTAPSTAAPEPTHPDDDHMGSTIREHEPSTLAGPANVTVPGGSVPGMDVSRWQGNVNWAGAYRSGARFAYVKATEGTTYTSPYFAQQYNGSAGVGMIRGAYHFALPANSSGKAQATWFVNHGGRWSADGRTLPPMLDIEYNPYGSNTCYGLSKSAMSAWIADFSGTVRTLTGRYPTIYTTTNWWNTCVGSSAFGANPLFIARYNSAVGALPPGWSNYTFWQYSDAGTFPGDQDVFRGSYAGLQALAGAAPTTASTPAVTAYYASLGGTRSYLGAAVGGEYAVAGGVGQDYTYGTIYYSAATGAHAMKGTILARYKSLGGPTSPLGFPTSDEAVASDGRGRTETFANSATMYWNPTANTAFAVSGPARDKYDALRGPAGVLSYPRIDTTVTPDGVGTYTHFTGAGGSIYYSPATGAHEVQGAIFAKWASLGWERSALGYPTGDEQVVPGGWRSTFQHGAISCDAATGAVTVTTA